MELLSSGTVSSAAAASPAAAGLLRILLVEDLVPDAEMISHELSKSGLKYTSCRVGGREDFERELKAFAPDIVLADHSVSKFSGLDVLDAVTARESDVPVIIVTSSHSEEIAVECLQRGAENYVPKSSLARLSSAILKALRRKETEREKQAAEEALRQSEEQYRLITENIRDLICLLDLRGQFVYASPSFQTVLGYRPEELIGTSSFDLAHTEDRQVLISLFEESRFLHEPRTGDIRYVHKDGRDLIFESAVSFVFDELGAPQRAVVVSRDISERKRAETEIERLAAFPRNNPNPVLAFASDGELIYFNDAAQAMAYTLRKEHPKDILPLNIAAMVKMCLATGESSLRLENTLAGRTLSWSFYPIQSNQVAHVYAEDVTERLELESRLRQSLKMESVGQLAAGVAHDFNNILTIIQGHAGLLQSLRDVSPGAGDSLRQISVACERAANLTRQLLMFSRKQLAQRQLIDLNDVLRESGKMLRVLLGESIQIHLDCLPDLPAVYADSGMIQQVIINLAANARDAMPKGGHLTFRSTIADVPETRSERFPDARAGRFVCLSVADTGLGMDAPTLERIFEPFFTTKDPGRGTGLGLATVYGIVKQHQGWLEVSSEVNQGTVFKIFLPAACKSAEPDTDFFRGPVCGGDETILVVEDEPALRELVLEILQQYGYKTIEAANGVRALEIWEQRKDELDLVLTDVMMPDGVSGRDLAEKIHAHDPDMKVIYTSGYPMDVLGRDFFQKDGVIFLQKPYHPQTLAKTVRDYLDA